MAILTLSADQAQPLRRFRRRAWTMIALCLLARGADAAFGLNLIDHTNQVAAQEFHACPISKEPLI